jgi:hypothetical protein
MLRQRINVRFRFMYNDKVAAGLIWDGYGNDWVRLSDGARLCLASFIAKCFE